MKIEIGESLVYSWLRHVKKCQIAQMNWKPSPYWPTTDDDLQVLQTEITNKFKDSPFDIFKKTSSLDQFFRQAEIDVIGMAYEEGKSTIYFVDVAFHENGLTYGSKEETIARVLKKYIRSYFIFRKYFNKFSNGIIYFVTPKMSIDKIYNPLIDEIGRLNICFNKYNFTPDFQLLANDRFKKEVLTPTMALCNEIADTNELFLRSAQLWKLFEDQANPYVVKPLKTDKTTVFKGEESPHIVKLPKIVMTLAPKKIGAPFLETILRTVGKTCFVEYYEEFRAVDEISNKELIERLMKKEGYERTSASTKVSQSRRIIKTGFAQKALEEIAKSGKLDDAVKAKAKALLKKYHSVE